MLSDASLFVLRIRYQLLCTLEVMNGLFEKKEKEEKEGVLTNGPKEGEKVESKPSNNIAASFAAQVRCHCDCF